MAFTPMAAVAVRMRRELDAPELALAVALLDEIENRLRARADLGDVATRLTEDETFAANFRAVCANAVVRVLVNPDGYRQEAVGPFSWSYDTRAAAGFLTVLEEELALLRPPAAAAEAFTIAPALTAPVPPYAVPTPLRAFDPLSSPGYWGDLS